MMERFEPHQANRFGDQEHRPTRPKTSKKQGHAQAKSRKLTRNKQESRSRSQDLAASDELLRSIENDSFFFASESPIGSRIKLPGGESILKVSDDLWQSNQDRSYLTNEAVDLLQAEEVEQPPHTAQSASIGERRQSDDGENFIKINLTLWQSELDGGFLPDDSIDKITTRLLPQRLPEDSVKKVGEEYFLQVRPGLWQSNADGGYVDSEGMNRMKG